MHFSYSSSTQVSLVPLPLDEFTTKEPSFRATLVNPPGIILIVFPERTKGLKSICLGATPDSTKVGPVDRAKVG